MVQWLGLHLPMMVMWVRSVVRWLGPHMLCVCMLNHSVVSDSLWPHRLQPSRLLCPWDFLGKNTGVGCHSLLQRVFLTQGSNPCLLHYRQILSTEPPGHASWSKKQKTWSRNKIVTHSVEILKMVNIKKKNLERPFHSTNGFHAIRWSSGELPSLPSLRDRRIWKQVAKQLLAKRSCE